LWRGGTEARAAQSTVKGKKELVGPGGRRETHPDLWSFSHQRMPHSLLSHDHRIRRLGRGRQFPSSDEIVTFVTIIQIRGAEYLFLGVFRRLWHDDPHRMRDDFGPHLVRLMDFAVAGHRLRRIGAPR